jgi:hypothetical protein
MHARNLAPKTIAFPARLYRKKVMLSLPLPPTHKVKSSAADGMTVRDRAYASMGQGRKSYDSWRDERVLSSMSKIAGLKDARVSWNVMPPNANQNKTQYAKDHASIKGVTSLPVNRSTSEESPPSLMSMSSSISSTDRFTLSDEF